ncbi:MAG: hypothetical protein R3C20_08615 [Planctomycetaceae bacterium]
MISEEANGSRESRSIIRIRGARTHNLQNIDVDLPCGKLIVMTGVSGSGKSSLAFDTLFAEGQRRYLESVSAQTRSFISQLPRPDVDDISGLPPTVCVDQRTNSVPVRTTLAITTEIYDFLRVLYARAGTAHCTECGQPVSSQTIDQIVQRTLQLPDRTKLMILSPMVRDRRGAHKEILERIARNGFVRARVDGELVDLADIQDLAQTRNHTIEAVIDRIIIKEGIEQRIRESVELACRESDGTCIVCFQRDDHWDEAFYSTRFSCAKCDLSFPTPEPRSFSFNSAWGACPKCEGHGARGAIEEDGANIRFLREACSDCHGSRLKKFPAAVTFFGVTISEFTGQSIASAFATIEKWSACLASADSPKDERAFENLSQESRLVASRTLPDIQRRLQCLLDVGLDYLSLDRATRTLSGGEFQRARLAACLGIGLNGACFVLDEPTAGLHPRDTACLLNTLNRLRDSGATVVVVEHDGGIMRDADWLVDLGPGAGIDGGHLLFSGRPADAVSVDSPTGDFLAGRLKNVPSGQPEFRTHAENSNRRSLFPVEGPGDFGVIRINNAALNNLQNVSVEIPLRQLVCVTGVSGSGKSSLIMETLLPYAAACCDIKGGATSGKHLQTLAQILSDVKCEAITGLDRIDRVVSLDSSPIGRSSRSCIATITGVWNIIRQLFTKTREARSRGYASNRFSFNSGDGRCGDCKGTGVQNLHMSFLPETTVPCPTCRGQRFNRATLSICFNSRNVADVLNLRVDEACQFFSEFNRIVTVLQSLQDAGLGYLKLGQPSSTFSGGESQRVRLATELATKQSAATLYIFDEPTSGLHPADVHRLIAILKRLVTDGHSVLVVEHQTDLMRSADWIIDVGPESGGGGGQIVSQGSPIELASRGQTATEVALRNESLR